jgi:predicted RNA binding protein YcfA (HicA-like mRNA interferase family)
MFEGWLRGHKMILMLSLDSLVADDKRKRRFDTPQNLHYIRTVCIVHNMNSKELIKRLEAEGWGLRGVKGSHHIYTHPSRPGHISIPHPKRDLGAGLVHKLLKQAGLK